MRVTQNRWTQAYFALRWLWTVKMNPKRADNDDSCPKNIRNGWLRLVAIISAVLIQATAHAQTVESAGRISIDYGFVTQHYQSTWSDPTLPAGVARGMPPSTGVSPVESISGNEGESSMPADTTNYANSTETASDTNEAAVLYAIDLGEDGMTMVVSAKTTLQPGDCTAIERSGTYFNLRSVNAGFCDPTNQATIASLRSVNVAAAQRCKVAREQLETTTVEENQTLTASEIGMLCDGS
jgi:hypothetical protein